MLMGLVQPEVEPGLDATAHNRAAIVAIAGDLFRQGAELVVLPECANHQYFPASREMLHDLAEPLDGPTVRAWKDLAAARGYLVGGLIERDGERLYNTAVLVGPRGLIGRYRKLHRFAWERDWLAPGDALPVFELPEHGVRVGLLICYDLRFGEAVQALAIAGVDLLAVPTTWTSVGKRVLWDRHGYALQDHLVIGYAYAHHIAIACADRVGSEGDVTFLGASIAVQPGGDVAAGPLDGHVSASAIANLDLARAQNKRIGGAGDLARDRRPECYRTVAPAPLT